MHFFSQLFFFFWNKFSCIVEKGLKQRLNLVKCRYLPPTPTPGHIWFPQFSNWTASGCGPLTCMDGTIAYSLPSWPTNSLQPMPLRGPICADKIKLLIIFGTRCLWSRSGREGLFCASCRTPRVLEIQELGIQVYCVGVSHYPVRWQWTWCQEHWCVFIQQYKLFSKSISISQDPLR